MHARVYIDMQQVRPDTQQVPVGSDPVSVYVDETVFQLDNGDRMTGVGALVLPREVSGEVIASALEALRDDPDRHDPATRRYDDETLSRGFFHASFDTKNAHSHLARAIKGSSNGRFLCSFARVDGASDEQSFRRSSLESLVPALNLRRNIALVFEQRSGFSRINAARLVERVFSGYDWSAYSQPFLSSYYANVDVSVKGKHDPGLQVADMLLWSVIQARFRPRTRQARFATWCGLTLFYDAEPADQSRRWVVYDLNGDDPALEAADGTSVAPYPLTMANIETTRDNNELANLYCYAERIVRSFVDSIPPHAEHLRLPIRATLDKLSDPQRATRSAILEVARHFVRLFDTLPLYAGLPPAHSAWPLLLKAKRFVGLALRQDLPHGLRTADFFARVRREHIATNPQAFGLSNGNDETTPDNG